ncbi:MAG: N-acetyltransferase family protein [Dehalococcoidia bacterium]
MRIREIQGEELNHVWPALAHLAGEEGAAGRLVRIHEMLSAGSPYCLLAEDDGAAAGLAVVENYRSAWIFVDYVATIREFLATEDARGELLAAIETRGRADGVNNLSRFTTAADPLLPWWEEAGFVEFMAAFRRPLDVEELEVPQAAPDDGIVIREVTDLDADWPKLRVLLEKLNQHHASIAERVLSPDREANTQKELAQELERGEALVMLAEDHGEAIATSSAELGERHADGSRTGFRSKLYVDEAYRGRGLPARFEARALPWLRQHGVTDVERWIVAGNERPRQIWTRRGYRPERLLLRKALG